MNSPMLQKLQFLESIFEEEDFIAGEQLFDDTKVAPKIEKSRSKYTVHLDRRTVEIKLSKGKLHFASDPAIDASESKQDEVLASLFLRKHIQHTAEEAKKPRKTSTRKTKPNNFSELLERIPKEQLLLFLNSYAKKDIHFAVKLESNFITKYSDIESKYEDVLARIVKPKSQKTPKLSQKDTQAFNHIIESFVAQADDLYSIQRYQELFDLIIACLKKIAYYNNVYLANNPRIERAKHQLVDTLKRMCGQSLAPAFSQEVLNKMIDIGQLSYYRPAEGETSIYSIIASHPLLTAELCNPVIENLHSKYLRTDKLERANVLVVALVLSSKFEASVKLSHELWDTVDIVPVLKKLLQGKYYDALQVHINILSSDDSLTRELCLLRGDRFVAIDQETDAIAEYLVWIGKRPKTFEIINRLNRLSEETLNANAEAITQAISHYPVTEQTHILHGIDMYNQLMIILDREADITLIQRYDRDLVLEHSDFLESFYTTWVSSYLESHFGSKSVEMVNHQIKRLNDIGMGTFANKLKGGLKTTFADRKNLVSSF